MVGFVNRAVFTAVSNGTVDFEVSSAVTGFLTPANAGAVDGVVYRYAAENAALTEWEIGYGVYTSSPQGLARTSITKSSNSNAIVSFTNPPTVRLVAFAEDFNVSGDPNSAFSVNKNASNQTISSSSATKLTWPTTGFDVGSEFASDKFTAANPGKYTIKAAAHVTALGVGTTALKLMLYKNGSLLQTLAEISAVSGLTDITLDGAALVAAVAGDYFETYVQFVGYTSGTATVDGTASSTWYSGVREAGGGNYGWDQIAKVSTDQSTTATSVTAITDLALALAANSLYEFEAVLIFNSSSTAGVKAAINGPASATASFVLNAEGSTTQIATAQHTLNTLNATAFGTVGSGSDVVCWINGFIKTGATAGNLQAQMAKVTSGTCIARKNSNLKVRLMGPN